MRERTVSPLDLFRDRLLAADPGRGMVRFALRTTLTVALATAVLAGVAALLGRPLMVFVIGAMVAMLSTVMVTDPTPAGRRGTMALVPVAAAASISLAAWTAHSAVLGAGMFVVVMFIGTWVRRFGPRWTALGMVAFMTYFFALFVQARPAQLPWMYLSLIIGVACGFLVRFLIVPDPAMNVNRVMPAIRAQMRLILWDLDRIVRGDATARHRAAIGRHVTKLNEVVLILREQGNREARLALFEAELAIQRLTSLAGRERRPEEDEAILHDLRALYHVPATPQARASIVWRTSPDDRFGSALRRLIAALDHPSLHRSEEEAHERAEARARRDGEEASHDTRAGSASDAPAADAGRADEAPQPRLLPTTRTAIQVAVAGTLAIAGGQLLVPGQWHWAAITAFLVFTGTTSRGDVLVKSWRRVLGTGLGVVAGAGLAILVGGNRPLSLALILLSIFAGFYLIQASYTLLMFWITVMIALLYGMLGLPSVELLQIRIEETLLGAVVGMVIASVLLPTRTKHEVEREGRALLHTLGEVIDACRRGLEGGGDREEVLDKVRDLDSSFQTLRQAGAPLAFRAPWSAPRASERWLAVLPLLVYEAHALVNLSREESGDREALAAAWDAASSRLRERIDPLAEAIASGRASVLDDATVRLAAKAPWPGEDVPEPYAVPDAAGPRAKALARSLSRIDWIVTVLAGGMGPASDDATATAGVR